MKERSLLDMMGKIDDALIEEAAHPEILLSQKRKTRRWYTSAKAWSTVAACLVIVVGMVAAVPYMRVTGDAVDESAMNDAIQNAIAMQQSAQAEAEKIYPADEDRISSEDMEIAVQSSVDEEAAMRSEALAKAEAEASKAAASAAEASKAAASAAAEASKSASMVVSQESISVASVTRPSSTHTASLSGSVDTEMTEPQPGQYQMDKITFAYSDHVLFSLQVEKNYQLVELTIPASINGQVITALADDFWLFCDQNPTLGVIHIPPTVTDFGNVEYLPKSVLIHCHVDSPAKTFFEGKGYQVLPIF